MTDLPTLKTKPTTFEEHTYMNREFDVIIERDVEEYYVASVPALPGCHTQAKSLDELMKRIVEAIELYLDTESVQLESLRFVGIQKVMVVR